MRKQILLFGIVLILLSSFAYATDFASDIQNYWTYDTKDITGTTLTDLVGTNDGFLQQSPTTGEKDVVLEGVRLDGLKKAINFTTKINSSTEDWTFNFWINVSAFPSMAYCRNDTSANYIYMTALNVIKVSTIGVNNEFDFAGNPITLDVLHMVTLTSDAGGMNLYLDGVISTDGEVPLSNDVFFTTIGYYNGVNIVSEAQTMGDAGLWNYEFSQAQVTELYTLQTNTLLNESFRQYPFTNLIKEITASNIYNGTAIQNFTATISNTTTSQNIITTNGTIYMTGYGSLINVTVWNATDYFNRSYTNQNTSIDLDSEHWQAEILYTAKQKITNTTLCITTDCFNGTVGTQFNSSNANGKTRFLLNFGDHDITGNVLNQPFNGTDSFSLSPLENTTADLFFGNVELNISARDGITNSSLTNFTVTITFNNSYTETISTSTGLIQFYGVNSSEVNGTYSIEISAPIYSDNSAVLNIDQISQNYSFNMFQSESVFIHIYNQEGGDLILENVSIQFINDLGGFTNYTVNGGFFIANLTPADYTIWFDSENFTKTNYQITVIAGSNQTLDAYLAPVNYTNIVTFEIFDEGDGSLLEGVSVAITRIVGDTQTQINVLSSDITGRVQFNYELNTEYCFVLSISTHITKSFCLSPIIFSTYSVNMERDSVTLLNTGDYFMINVLYDPHSFVQDANPFSIQFISADGKFTQYSWVLRYRGAILDLDLGSNANGELFETNINIINPTFQDFINLTYSYGTSAAGIREYSFKLPINVNSSVNNTFYSIKTGDKTYGMGVFERSLIVSAAAIVLAGLGFFFGGFTVAGLIALGVYGFFTYIEFINIWVSIIPIISIFIFWVWGSKQ